MWDGVKGGGGGGELLFVLSGESQVIRVRPVQVDFWAN